MFRSVLSLLWKGDCIMAHKVMVSSPWLVHRIVQILKACKITIRVFMLADCVLLFCLLVAWGKGRCCMVLTVVQNRADTRDSLEQGWGFDEERGRLQVSPQGFGGRLPKGLSRSKVSCTSEVLKTKRRHASFCLSDSSYFGYVSKTRKAGAARVHITCFM